MRDLDNRVLNSEQQLIVAKIHIEHLKDELAIEKHILYNACALLFGLLILVGFITVGCCHIFH